MCRQLKIILRCTLFSIALEVVNQSFVYFTAANSNQILTTQYAALIIPLTLFIRFRQSNTQRYLANELTIDQRIKTSGQ